jgi:hypothetical protein
VLAATACAAAAFGLRAWVVAVPAGATAWQGLESALLAASVFLLLLAAGASLAAGWRRRRGAAAVTA